MQNTLIDTLKQLSGQIDRWDRTRQSEPKLTGVQQAILLHLLGQKEREIYAVDLHKALGLSRSSISAALKGLEQKGCLTILRDPSDDRRKQLILSDSACRMRAQLEQEQQQREQALCRGIPPGQLAEIRRGLEIMLQNLKTES